MSALNSPLEHAFRVMTLLAEAYPRQFDVSQLVYLDHLLLHTADVDGPESLHPAVPIRAGEMGVKRQLLHEGLDIMTRAGLVEMRADDEGIHFAADDGAEAFLDLLETRYAAELRDRARWVVEAFAGADLGEMREIMRTVFVAWDEEFQVLHPSEGDE